MPQARDLCGLKVTWNVLIPSYTDGTAFDF
jgi:hypothetical protein